MALHLDKDLPKATAWGPLAPAAPRTALDPLRPKGMEAPRSLPSDASTITRVGGGTGNTLSCAKPPPPSASGVSAHSPERVAAMQAKVVLAFSRLDVELRPEAARQAAQIVLSRPDLFGDSFAVDDKEKMLEKMQLLIQLADGRQQENEQKLLAINEERRTRPHGAVSAGAPLAGTVVHMPAETSAFNVIAYAYRDLYADQARDPAEATRRLTELVVTVAALNGLDSPQALLEPGKTLELKLPDVERLRAARDQLSRDGRLAKLVDCGMGIAVGEAAESAVAAARLGKLETLVKRDEDHDPIERISSLDRALLDVGNAGFDFLDKAAAAKGWGGPERIAAIKKSVFDSPLYTGQLGLSSTSSREAVAAQVAQTYRHLDATAQAQLTDYLSERILPAADAWKARPVDAAAVGEAWAKRPSGSALLATLVPELGAHSDPRSKLALDMLGRRIETEVAGGKPVGEVVADLQRTGLANALYRHADLATAASARSADMAELRVALRSTGLASEVFADAGPIVEPNAPLLAQTTESRGVALPESSSRSPAAELLRVTEQHEAAAKASARRDENQAAAQQFASKRLARAAVTRRAENTADEKQAALAQLGPDGRRLRPAVPRTTRS